MSARLIGLRRCNIQSLKDLLARSAITRLTAPKSIHSAN